MTTDEELRALSDVIATSLALRRGDSVLVSGCGSGHHALAVADQVGPNGHVLGVDHRPARIADARRRGAAVPHARFIAAEPGRLGLAPQSFDRGLLDSGTADLDDPATAIAEAIAAVQIGGFVVGGAPDWATLTLNMSNIPLAHRLAAAIDRGPGSPRLGSTLAGLFMEAGLTVTSQTALSVGAHSWESLVLISDLPSRIGRAVSDGDLDLADADALLTGLETAASTGEILATLTTTIVTGRRV